MYIYFHYEHYLHASIVVTFVAVITTFQPSSYSAFIRVFPYYRVFRNVHFGKVELSLFTCGVLSSLLLLLPQRFGRCALRLSSYVCPSGIRQKRWAETLEKMCLHVNNASNVNSIAKKFRQIYSYAMAILEWLHVCLKFISGITRCPASSYMRV